MSAIKEVKYLQPYEEEILEKCKEVSLSVGSVSYGAGHDGPSVTYTLKIKSRIKGIAWDDSWGGGFDYQDKPSGKSGDIKLVLDIMDEIIKKSKPYTYSGMKMTWNYDTIVSLLGMQTEDMKICKKKTMIRTSKAKNQSQYTATTFTYPRPYSKEHEEFIKKDLQKDGYIEYEIVNKRMVA